MLHGYLSCKETFAAQVAYFSRFYRVTALDFLGFGQSAALKEPFGVDEYAEWTEEVLSRLGVENAHVLAHSFGCRVAVKMAKRRGQVFDKILLTGPAGVVLPRSAAYKIKVKTYRFIRRFAPKFAERRFGSKEYRTLSPIMKESYKKIVNEDLRACAKEVKNRVLIVEGEQDLVTTKREAEAYLSAFPNAELIMTGGGHFAFLDDPIAFNLIAEEFFYE